MSLQYESPRETLHGVPSRFDLAVLGLRLMGIWLLIQVAMALSLFGAALIDGYRCYDDAPWSVVLVPAVYLALGIWFVFWPDGLARRILPKPVSNPVTTGMAGTDLQAIAFSAVGLLLVIGSLPMVLEIGYRALQRDINASAAFEPSITFVMGLILFFLGRGLSALWQRLRTTSTVPAERTD